MRNFPGTYYGTFPEPFRNLSGKSTKIRFRNHSGTIPENLPKSDSGYTTEYIWIPWVVWGWFLYSDTFPTHFTHVKDDFIMNPLIQGKSGTTPVMSRNAFSTNQGTNEDDSQSDPHPEAGIFGNQTLRKSDQKDRPDMVTGVTEQTRNGQKDRRDNIPYPSWCG